MDVYLDYATTVLFSQKEMSMNTEHGRGIIRDNSLAALVTSKVYKVRQEKKKKGRGSYSRTRKHGRDGSESFQKRLNKRF